MKFDDIKNKKYRVPKDYFEKNYKKFSDNYPGYYLEYGGKIHTKGEDGKLGAFEILYIRGELELETKTKSAPALAKLDVGGELEAEAKAAKTKLAEEAKSKK